MRTNRAGLRSIPLSAWVVIWLLSLCVCSKVERVNGINEGKATARQTMNDLIECNDKLAADYWAEHAELEEWRKLNRFALNNGKGMK